MFTLPLASLCLLEATCSFGQLVGTNDLTQPSPNSNAVSSSTREKDFCHPSGGVADGVELPAHPAKLTLTISRAELGMIDGQSSIIMALRLKNDGDESTSIPWSSSPVESIPLSGDWQSDTLGYEVATIDFFLGPPHSTDPVFSLRDEVALWSQPGNLSQLIQLKPGEWIELKFRARVVCKQSDSATCPLELEQRKMQVSAWWYQRL
jgi:hypothetical protein